MWAYVDETGNTGNKIFDENQPIFMSAALATKINFDLIYRHDIMNTAKKVDASALHANELGVGRLEVIALDLTRILKAADARFMFSRIEKKYLAATKVFDTYFDQGENLTVPWNL